MLRLWLEKLREKWTNKVDCPQVVESSILSSPFMNTYIRWMIRRDMPEVIEIENDSFEYAWTEEDFIHCLRQRNSIGMVAEINEDKIAGYMIYSIEKNRIILLNMAVHKDFRRQKIGLTMVEKLFGKLSEQRRNRIMLEVRETNLDAQLFFSKVGFRAIKVNRNAYKNGEDSYLMVRRYHTELKK